MKTTLESYGKVIRKYKGKGKIVCPNGEEHSLEFKVAQLSDGKIIGFFYTKNDAKLFVKIYQQMSSLSFGNYQLIGKINSGQLVKADIFIIGFNSDSETDKAVKKAIIQFTTSKLLIQFEKDNSKIKEYHFGITNFEFIGTDQTITPDGCHHNDKIVMRLSSREIVVKQLRNYREILSEIKATQSTDVTSEIIVRHISGDNINKIQEIVEDLCSLLSLARGTYIDWIYIDVYLKDGRKTKQVLRDNYTRPYTGAHQLIRVLPLPDTKDFLVKCYENYKEHKNSRGLYPAIEFYVESKSLTILESKYVTAWLALEVLNSRCTKKRSIMSKGEFREIRKNILETANSLSLKYDKKLLLETKVPDINRLPLAKSIENVLDVLSVDSSKYNIRHLNDLRNKIVHEGSFGKENRSYYPEYVELCGLFEHLILAVMKYDGYYIDCLDNYKRKKFGKSGNVRD